MNALTQVWVFCFALCSVVLVVGFKIAGRLGLLVSFFLCIGLLYLLLHKGLELYLNHLRAEEKKGSDSTGFKSLLKQFENQYGFNNTVLYYTQEPTHPLVWQTFNTQLHVLIHPELVKNMELTEKKMLAHLLLSHGREHSRLRRRFLSILFLAFSPISSVFSSLFNLAGHIVGLKKQILKADLEAFRNIGTTSFESKNNFSLFLRKLHHLSYHKTAYKKGESFFSILSTANNPYLKLHLTPTLHHRMSNLSGDY